MKTVPRITVWFIGIPGVLTALTMAVGVAMAISESEVRLHEFAIGIGLAVLPYVLFLLMTLLFRKRDFESVMIMIGFAMGLTGELLFAIGALSGMLSSDISLMVLPLFLWAGCFLTAITVGITSVVRKIASRGRRQ